MRICFFAPANSAHIIKWCQYFVAHDHEVHVISFTPGEIEGVTVHFLGGNVLATGSDMQKLMYLTAAGKVRKLIKAINPDVLNVHYATSYGTVAALTGVKQYILSVWGSDIYEFPQKSKLHRLLLEFSLKKAPYLFSTSYAMAKEASLYTNKEFFITPFGVKMDLFSPQKRHRTDDAFVVGTVKTLAPVYGIDVLLKAASLIHRERPDIPLSLRIAGKGPCENEYKAMADELEIGAITTWLGFIPQEQAAEEWANMDVAVICSNSESFGVAAVEAQSCGCAVIVSDVPGLMEATAPSKTSIVVPAGDHRAVADALLTLYENPEQRIQMGTAGIQYVKDNYEYSACFEKIADLFRQFQSNGLK